MKKLRTILGILCMLACIGLFFAPDVRTFRLNIQSSRQIREFDEQRKESLTGEVSSEKQYADNVSFETGNPDRLYQEANAYNQQIYENGQDGLKDAWSYEQSPVELTELPAGEMFGYIEIPAMEVRLPLYVGADSSNLAKGAAVLGQTSLPVGGNHTNCGVAGHRGYKGSPYFREIENLKIGDEVSITNRWETLVYQVVEIQVILPYDIDAIRIQEGRELVTLVTCHPYRSNGRYRYVVYCERKNNTKDAGAEPERLVEYEQDELPGGSSRPELIFERRVRRISAAAIVSAVLLLLVLRIKRRKR